jgi:hypothetical protein
MKNSDMPAMPLNEPELWADGCGNSKATVFAHGLTKREYFAGLAMQGVLASDALHLVGKEIAGIAVSQADALLAELEESK